MLRLQSELVFVGLFSLVVTTTSSILADGHIPKPTGETIVDSNAKLELLWTRSAPIEGGLSEGPAVGPDGSIYFSDIPFGEFKGMIQRYNPQTGETTVFTDDSGKSNGLIFGADGHLYAAEGAGYGGRRISRYSLKDDGTLGERVTIADNFGGKHFNAPNDICVDSKGRVYFTDPRYVGHEPRELKHRAVYRITITDGKSSVVEVTHHISKPNGIALSPDETTLYVADHDNGTDDIPNTKNPVQGDMKIYAYPLGDDGLVNGPRRTLINFGREKGCDGMTVDERGNVYLTVRSATRPGVMVVDPNGVGVGFIPTGPRNQAGAEDKVGLPSNVEFGVGPEKNRLYITVDKSLYRIRLKVKGFHVQYGDKVE